MEHGPPRPWSTTPASDCVSAALLGWPWGVPPCLSPGLEHSARRLPNRLPSLPLRASNQSQHLLQAPFCCIQAPPRPPPRNLPTTRISVFPPLRNTGFGNRVGCWTHSRGSNATPHADQKCLQTLPDVPRGGQSDPLEKLCPGVTRGKGPSADPQETRGLVILGPCRPEHQNRLLEADLWGPNPEETGVAGTVLTTAPLLLMGPGLGQDGLLSGTGNTPGLTWVFLDHSES